MKKFINIYIYGANRRAYRGNVNQMNKTDYICSIVFFLTLISVLFFASVTAFLSLENPVVLGTEINSDGTIEYLCLGRSCEDISPSAG